MNDRIFVLIIYLLMFTGCIGTLKVDSANFIVDKGQKESVPTVCKGLYDSSMSKVAIAPFSNNTTFDYAAEIQTHVSGVSQKQVKGQAAVSAQPGAAQAVWGLKERKAFRRDTTMTRRTMYSKLSESVEDGVMEQMKSIPGLKVYARRDLKKVFYEQELQESYMDDATAVKRGKLAGVRYIVTGSLNNIAISYTSTQSLQKSSRDVSRRESRRREKKGDQGSALAADLVGAGTAAVAEAMEGWKVEVEIIVNVLDVQTGEVILSKKITGKKNIGKMPYPGFDAVVGGVKKAASANMGDLKPAIMKNFTTRGYIYQTKTSPNGEQRIALVNLGKKDGLMEGSELHVYTFNDVADPISGKRECDQAKLPLKLKVTDQLQSDKAWVVIDGNPAEMKRVKIGQLVETKQKGLFGF